MQKEGKMIYFWKEFAQVFTISEKNSFMNISSL